MELVPAGGKVAAAEVSQPWRALKARIQYFVQKISSGFTIPNGRWQWKQYKKYLGLSIIFLIFYSFFHFLAAYIIRIYEQLLLLYHGVGIGRQQSGGSQSQPALAGLRKDKFCSENLKQSSKWNLELMSKIFLLLWKKLDFSFSAWPLHFIWWSKIWPFCQEVPLFYENYIQNP